MSKVSRHIADGLMWQNAEGKWCKRCPSCNKEVVGKDGSVTTKFNVSHSIIIGQVCHSCIKVGKPSWSSLHKEEMSRRHSGENHPMFGRHHTDEMKKRQAERNIGKKLSEDMKKRLSETSKKAWRDPDKRKRMIYASKWNNISVDKGQLELLGRWNSIGFQFEPNYQLKTDNDLFYIDGYDKEHNVVLEYDSKYHTRVQQKQKDLMRQKKVIDILHPKKFWRYSKVNGSFMECITQQNKEPVAVAAEQKV